MSCYVSCDAMILVYFEFSYFDIFIVLKRNRSHLSHFAGNKVGRKEERLRTWKERGKEKHLELLVMEYFTVILIHEHLGCCPEESLLMKSIHVLDSKVMFMAFSYFQKEQSPCNIGDFVLFFFDWSNQVLFTFTLKVLCSWRVHFGDVHVRDGCME